MSGRRAASMQMEQRKYRWDLLEYMTPPAVGGVEGRGSEGNSELGEQKQDRRRIAMALRREFGKSRSHPQVRHSSAGFRVGTGSKNQRPIGKTAVGGRWPHVAARCVLSWLPPALDRDNPTQVTNGIPGHGDGNLLPWCFFLEKQGQEGRLRQCFFFYVLP